MKLKDLGEFELIRRITRKPGRKDVHLGIGDDAAVLTDGTLLSTDCLVENIHFRKEWMTPQEIGSKAIQVNVSDIAAMGGVPRHILVSIFAPDEMETAYLDKVYSGMRKACKRYNLDIIGGNFSSSKEFSISITITGYAEKPILRSTAKPGDYIFVSGPLGAGHAGLRALQSGLHSKSIKSYRNPRAHLEFANAVKGIATSMIDISDSLLSDLGHIANSSGCKAIVESRLIPVSDCANDVAMHCGENTIDYALHGGDDYRLLYTVKDIAKGKGFLIGRMAKGHGILIDGKPAIARGFQHFTRKI
jgi:thiamine-monophosphate kinase